MDTEPHLLKLDDISKRYDTAEESRVDWVLNNLNLAISEGDAVCIVGPSGSGKSTLLNIMGSLDYPTNGKVLFEGQDITGWDEKALAGFRNRKIGFVFQSHHLLPQCSALENVLVPALANNGTTSRETTDYAHELLDRAGLADRTNHKPGQLSGGERQRVAVVRALINRPALLLADEPTGALDQQTSDSLSDLLIELNREERVTLVVVTHSLSLADRMQKVYELKGGALQARDRAA